MVQTQAAVPTLPHTPAPSPMHTDPLSSPPWPTQGPLGQLAALQHWDWETFAPEPWIGCHQPVSQKDRNRPQHDPLRPASDRARQPWVVSGKAWPYLPYWLLPLSGILAVHGIGLILLSLGIVPRMPAALQQHTPAPSHWELAFLSANPEAPSHPPDQARYVSTADQQAAQPCPLPAVPLGPDPSIMGTEAHSQAITQATAAAPSTAGGATSRPCLLAQADATPAAKLADLSLSPSTTAQEATPVAPWVPQPLAKPQAYRRVTSPSRYPDAPMPRPSLAGQKDSGPPAPLRKTHTRVARQGLVAADTALSPFGLYTQDLLTAIATQWHILGRTHQASLPSTRAQVRIAFELDPQGQVTGLRVQSSSGHPLADLICQDAILSRSPFGPWSPEMLAHLGKAQTVQIHFFYE